MRIAKEACGAAGCLDFTIFADLIDPSRINIVERWASHLAVETVRGNSPSDEQGAAMRSMSAAEYDIAAMRGLFGNGAARTRSTASATHDELGAARSDRTASKRRRREPQP